MKILTTVSAVVFLMILTTGLATAKKVPVPTFPFTATGDFSIVRDTGVVEEGVMSAITVNDAGNGLFWGIILLDSSLVIDFSAVRDSSGVYTLNGIDSGGKVTVAGAFTITYVKHKGFVATIQLRTLGTGDSVAGIFSQ
jgi:hypothetical protein